MSKQNQNPQYPVYPHNYQHAHQQHHHPPHLHPHQHPQQYWPQYPYMDARNQGYYSHQQPPPPMVYGNYQYHPQQYSQYQPYQSNQTHQSHQSHQNHQQYDRNVNQRGKKQQKIQNVPKRDEKSSNKDLSIEDNDIINSDSNQSEEQEDEQILYQKTKMIAKKRDPVLDTPQQILKWIQARKKNYPSKKKNQINKERIGDEMSILESKIRKKIMLVTSDGKGLMKKLKNMHILKRLINDPNFQAKKKNKKNDGKDAIKKIKLKNLKNQKMGKIIQEKEEICQQNKSIKNDEEENKSQNQQSQQKEISIRKQPKIQEIKLEPKIKGDQDQQKGGKVSGLTPDDMIKHLRQKQTEDKQFYDQLLSYKTNSLNYKYSSKTLETNFLLEDIFEQSSYLLQIIRHIAKKNFFDIENKSKQ